MSIVNFKMLVRTVLFYVLNILILFLLSFKNINKLGIYFNNLENALIYMFNNKKVFVVRY